MDLAMGVRARVTDRTRFTLRVGRALSGFSLLFLAFDAAGKLLALPPVVRATAELGFAPGDVTGIGAALAVCGLLYALPRTAPIGAVLLTGYLGGAVAANVRVGAPFVSHTLFPVFFAAAVWLGLYLRDSRVRAMVRQLRDDA